MSVPDQGYCPTCKCVLLLSDRGLCVWCDHPVACADPRRGHAVCMSDQVLSRANRMHQDGMSLNAICRELVGRTHYASPESMLDGLIRQFRNRGWYIRPRIEATRLAMTTHGISGTPEYQRLRRRRNWLVQGVRCSATARTGKPCGHWALKGSDLCRFHHPDHRDEVVAHTKRLNALRHPGGAS